MAEGKSRIAPEERVRQSSKPKESVTPSALIKVDYRNLFERMVGSEGLTEAMMKEADGDLEAVHAAVMQDLRSGYESRYAALALPELIRPRWMLSNLQRLSSASIRI